MPNSENALNETILKRLQDDAESLASEAKGELSLDRIYDLLQKSVRLNLEEWYTLNRSLVLDDKGRIVAQYVPSLFRARSDIGFAKAIALFENSDIDELGRREMAATDLGMDGTIGLTADHAYHLGDKYLSYLLRTEEHLIKTGYPSVSYPTELSFAPETFFKDLSIIYPVKQAIDVCQHASNVEGNNLTICGRVTMRIVRVFRLRSRLLLMHGKNY
jgi:hypothetical protein